jgi:hypothetical protein
MKRMILAVVAMLSMTMTFAKSEMANMENEMNAYEMNFSVYSMTNALKLNDDQAEAVEDINRIFNKEMGAAAKASADKRSEMKNKAVKKNLSYMHYVLSEQQYHKYLIYLNATMINRGLN